MTHKPEMIKKGKIQVTYKKYWNSDKLVTEEFDCPHKKRICTGHSVMGAEWQCETCGEPL